VSHLDGEFADFEIIREVARGGMGVVYEAIQLSMKRKVALKILPYSVIGGTIRKTRFQIESQALAMLQHDNIIPIYYTGEVRGNPYFVMPFIDGVNLDCFIKIKNSSLDSSPCLVVKQLNDSMEFQEEYTETQHFNPDEVNPKSDTGAPTTSFELNLNQFESVAKKEQVSFKLSHQSNYFDTVARWGIQALSALQHAHVMGVIHRDVKPANMLINESGHLWLTDFGLAKISLSAGVTNTDAVMGTARYMSPEQASGKQEIITHRTDIYSLGVSLYELVTETHFYPDNNNIQQIHNVLNVDPIRPRKINPQIPKDFETIILKATSKEIENRYHSASDMGADLQRMLDNIPIHANRPSICDKFSKLCKRYRVASATILFSFLIVSALSFMFMLIFSTKNNDLQKLNNKYELSLIDIRKAKQKTELANKKTNLALEEAREKNYINTMKLASEASKRHDSSQVLNLISPLEPKEGETDIRGMEWYVLKNSFLDVQKELELSPKSLYTFTRNPQSKLIATAGAESIIYLLDSVTLEIIRTIPTDQIEINGLDFNKSGTLIASTGDDGTIDLWNTDTGNNELTITAYPQVQGEEGARKVYSVKYTPDEKHLITSANDTGVKMWDISTGQLSGEFRGHKNDANVFDISSDGKFLATGGFDASVKLWRVRDQRELKSINIPVFPTNTEHVTSLVFTKDQKSVVIGSKNHSITVWDLNKNELSLIGFHNDPIQSILLSDNEQKVIATDRSGTIKIWAINNNIDLTTDKTPLPLYSQLLHKGRVYSSILGGNNTAFLTVGKDGYLRKTSINKFEANNELRQHDDVYRYHYFRQLKVLAFYTYKCAYIYNEVNEQFVHYWKIPSKDVESICMSQDGRTIVTGHENGEIHLWDYENKEHIAKWSVAIGKPIRCIAISQDGKFLAYSINKETIRIHNIENGLDQILPVSSVDHPELYGQKVKFSPTHNQLAYYFENTVYIWDCESHKLLYKFPDHIGGIEEIIFTDDGSKLIVSDNNRSIHFWDMKDGTQLRPPWKHTSSVLAIALTPDERTLITSGRAEQITFWNYKHGQPVHSIKYRISQQMSLLNSGRLLTHGLVKHFLETLYLGDHWDERWNKNLKKDYLIKKSN
jgi:eukaryotic-like serine/threonine-protein kinase